MTRREVFSLTYIANLMNAISVSLRRSSTYLPPSIPHPGDESLTTSQRIELSWKIRVVQVLNPIQTALKPQQLKDILAQFIWN